MHTFSGLGSKRRMRAGSGLLLLATLGCGSSSKTSSFTSAATAAPQVYFAPYVVGTTNASEGGGAPIPLAFPQTYTFDDAGGAFSQTTYALVQPPQQEGAQVINAGSFSVNGRSLRSLGITANYVLNTTTNHYDAIAYTPAQTGSFAVELAGQAGGLVQLLGQPAAPLTAATACPASSTPQTYLFLTIPSPLVQPSDYGTQFSWDPTSETAYGSVDISASGSAVTMANIAQHTLPSVGGTGAPAQPGAASATGACASTFFGNTISVPGELIITAPGNGQSAPPQATVGIGPSGLLVESNFSQGSTDTLPGTSPALYYNSVLGAGTGAVGLPKPSAPLDTAAVVGAQYLGFINSAGSQSVAFTSHLASFGFSSVPSSCVALAPATATLIYGGDYPGDDPTSSANGFGQCDFAIDLGTQDAANAGLYAHAQVTAGAGYPGNATSAADSFPAVAIVGMLGGKYAIFVLGSDSSQPWVIYLLQSN